MNIWVLDSARRERRVTSGPGGELPPDWSPDGAALVFFSGRGGNTDIWRVRLADTALTRLTENPALDIRPAACRRTDSGSRSSPTGADDSRSG